MLFAMAKGAPLEEAASCILHLDYGVGLKGLGFTANPRKFGTRV